MTAEHEGVFERLLTAEGISATLGARVATPGNRNKHEHVSGTERPRRRIAQVSYGTRAIGEDGERL